MRCPTLHKPVRGHHQTPDHLATGPQQQQKVRQLIDTEVLELCPVRDLRGLTFDDIFIILDEAQNTSKKSLTDIVGRHAGPNCKLVITGDPEDQSDRNSANWDAAALVAFADEEERKVRPVVAALAQLSRERAQANHSLPPSLCAEPPWRFTRRAFQPGAKRALRTSAPTVADAQRDQHWRGRCAISRRSSLHSQAQLNLTQSSMFTLLSSVPSSMFTLLTSVLSLFAAHAAASTAAPTAAPSRIGTQALSSALASATSQSGSALQRVGERLRAERQKEEEERRRKGEEEKAKAAEEARAAEEKRVAEAKRVADAKRKKEEEEERRRKEEEEKARVAAEEARVAAEKQKLLMQAVADGSALNAIAHWPAQHDGAAGAKIALALEKNGVIRHNVLITKNDLPRLKGEHPTTKNAMQSFSSCMPLVLAKQAPPGLEDFDDIRLVVLIGSEQACTRGGDGTERTPGRFRCD